MSARALPLLLVALAACSGGGDEVYDATQAPEAGSTPSGQYYDPDTWIDVIPADQGDGSRAPRALPQAFGPYPALSLDRAAHRLDLDPPVELHGTLTGQMVTPYAGLGGLPTVAGPVAGRVRLERTDGTAAYDVPTDAAGQWTVDLVPGDYDLVATPDSTRLAPAWDLVDAREGGDAADLLLDEEQALYGFVRLGPAPYAACEVLAIDAEGHVTATTTTDASGFYEIRVPPGQWTVLTSGAARARDPLLSSTPIGVLDGLGAQIDVAYPITTRAAASVHVEGEDGAPVAGALVRFTAVVLDDFQGLDAELVLENATSQGGDLDLVLPAGLWTVQVIPASDSSFTPLTLPEPLEIRADGQLPPIVLAGTAEVAGRVVDATGAPLPDARIACVEDVEPRRSWSALSGPDGAFAMTTSSAPLECTATPPGDRTDLALGRVVVDPTEATEWTFLLPVGTAVHGTVTLDGAPESYAVVEIHTTDGVLLGSGLTDAEGAFTVAIPPPATLD